MYTHLYRFQLEQSWFMFIREVYICTRYMYKCTYCSHVTGDVVLFENAKMHYPVVQLNIKRCHSDGCDTRVHHVKALGFK